MDNTDSVRSASARGLTIAAWPDMFRMAIYGLWHRITFCGSITIGSMKDV